MVDGQKVGASWKADWTAEIMDPLRRLMVDEVEDDVSGRLLMSERRAWPCSRRLDAEN